MSNIITTLRNAPKRSTALIAMIAAAVIVPAALYAWGPTDRPTFTADKPADYITFNSITDNKDYGDERNFVRIKDAADQSAGNWKDEIVVQPGKEYLVQMYVHNNAASSLNLTATNTRVMANVPTTTGKKVQIDGFITADNAKPKQVWDQAIFTSDRNFNLAYVNGSTKLYNNAFGKAGTTLSDNIVTNQGALVGYDKLDGKVPGCFQYSGYVSFKVKAQVAETANFTVTKEVSKHGANDWKENYTAKPGETVDYLIQYKNIADAQQDNVMISDKLPAGMTYVTGSTMLGTPVGTAKASDNIVKDGINIGSYKKGGGAWMTFSAKVPANDKLPVCGTNKLINTAKATTDYGWKEDTATVTVPKECLPTPVYKCDSLTKTKIDRTNYKFTGKATAKDGATIVNYTFNFGDGKSVTTTNPVDVMYEYAKEGTYTVKMSVTVKVAGSNKTVSGPNCETTVIVEKPPVVVKPVYTCDSLTATKISRTTFNFTGKATAKNGATIVNYTFNFGDGKSATVTNPTDVEHIYAKEGTYTVKMSVTVKVDGSNKTISGPNCEVKVTVEKPPVNKIEVCDLDSKKVITINEKDFDAKKHSKDLNDCKEKPPVTPPVENCPVPGKEHLPKDSKDCVENPVTELPTTGAGSDILAMIGAGSLIAAASYYVASRRI